MHHVEKFIKIPFRKKMSRSQLLVINPTVMTMATLRKNSLFQFYD